MPGRYIRKRRTEGIVVVGLVVLAIVWAVGVAVVFGICRGAALGDRLMRGDD